MPRMNDRFEIALTADQCREAGIRPGDEYRSLVADGRITIVKKTAGAARGFLRHVVGDPGVSEEKSLRDGLDDATH